jgi:hypothetical protein
MRNDALQPAGPTFSAVIFTAGKSVHVSTAEELSILAAVAHVHGWAWTIRHARQVISQTKGLGGW